jgi:hypothetical protein
MSETTAPLPTVPIITPPRPPAFVPTSSLEARVAHLERLVRILFDRGPT